MEKVETSYPSMRNFVHLLFKHKRHIVIFFLLSLVVAALVVVLRKPVYVASSTLLVKLSRDNLLQSARGERNAFVFVEQRELISSEREILKSGTLIEKVIREIGPGILYEDLADKGNDSRGSFFSIFGNWGKKDSMLAARDGQGPEGSEASARKFKGAVLRAEKALWVEDGKKSNLINVNFKHGDPQVASQFLNKLVKAYMERHLEIHQTRKAFDFFQHQTDSLKAKLESNEEKLNQLRSKNKVSSFTEQKSLLLKRESEIRDAMNQTLRQNVELESRIGEMRRQLAITPDKIEQGQEVGANPLLMNTLESRLVELELKEKELLTKYTDESRLVQNVRDEIRVVREKVAKQANQSNEKSTSGMNPMYQHLQRELLRDEPEFKAVKSKLKTLQNQLSTVQEELGAVNQIEEEHDKLKNQVEIDRENHRLYLAKLEDSRISDAMDAEKISNVSLIEPARSPPQPSGLPGKLILLIGFLGGIVGGFLLVIMMEFFNESLETPEDVENVLKAPVLTSIPYFK